MKRYTGILYGLILLMFLSAADFRTASAQEKKEGDASKWKLKWTGFVKNDFWWDTRQVYTSREDLFLFYPMNESLDADGRDINGDPVFNFSAMTTRLTLGFTTPDVLGAKVSGVIEGDFSGVSNNDINGLRLRHAFGKLTWKHAEFLAGQYWHPLFTPDVSPAVASLNTGAPFQPFNRTPQASLTGIFGKFRIMGAIISQRDNSSDGPSGLTSTYLRNAVLPNLYFQVQFRNDHHTAGVGADYKEIKPSFTIVNSVLSPVLKTWSFLAWYKMNVGDFTFRIKGLYGQNLSEHLMLGGYASNLVFGPDGEPELSLTPSRHIFTWAQMSYGKKYQGYLFAGFAKNLGTAGVYNMPCYGRGSNVDYVYRVTPGFAATFGKLQVNLEAEYTVAAYGTTDEHGHVNQSKEIPNLRTLLTVFYHF